MAVTIDKMFQMGLHLGHQSKQVNPKMSPYICGKKRGEHVIDLVQTYFFLKKASRFLAKSASQKKTFLFVSRKKQLTELIATIAPKCNSFYVNQRWLGGLLTNWETVKKSLDKLAYFERQEKSGILANLSKKELASWKRQKDRLNRELGGLRGMVRLPDVVIVIGQPESINAVRECRKLGIPNLTILDTNCDPTLADIFIPANDDSVTSLRFLLTTFVRAIQRGQSRFLNLKQPNIN